MLKHLPKDSKRLKKHCFVVNKMSTSTVHQLIEESGFVTRGLTATQIITAKTNNAKDLNIHDRISKFQNQLKDEYVYRIPLKCFLETGKINSVVKIDFRIKCHLATEIKKLFESKKVLASTASIPTPDAKIIFTKAPFIQYEQLLLDKKF